MKIEQNPNSKKGNLGQMDTKQQVAEFCIKAKQL